VAQKSASWGAWGGKRRGALIAGAALCFALCAQAAFAQAGNHQKVYPIDSEVYQAIKALYIRAGLALPSTSGPWTEDELLLMLGRLDTENLADGERAAYEYAERTLKAPARAFTFSGAVTAEAYAHSNPEDFTRLDDYIRPMNLTKPFLALDFELRLTPYAYGFGEFSLGNEKYNAILDENGKKSVGSAFFGSSAFSTNIPMVPPATLNDLNFNFPNRTFISLGVPGLNLEIGRERLSWGPGESGNFMVGSQVDYHNNVRLTAYNDQFKYLFNVSGFPSPNEYYTTDENETVVWNDDAGQTHDGLNFFIAHRLEWRLFNKVNMALSEAIMYQPEDGQADLQYFLPTILMHNLYRTYDANSLLSLEVDWAALPALNLYGQIAVDDFHLPGEPAPGADDDANPDAFGFMLGAKTAFPLWGGMLSGSFEGAYTDPYLYLRAQRMTANKKNRELNYVVANRYYSAADGAPLLFVEEFLGYRWGGDAIVLNANAAYRSFGKWSAGANLMFMVHGTFDKWTRWSAVDIEDNSAGWDAGLDAAGDYQNRPGYQSTPTDHHYQGNYADENAAARNAPYYLTALSLSGAWNILRDMPGVKSLAVYGQADFVFVANKGNIKGVNAFDAQFTLGASYGF
jgi:hypothetical protein